MDDQERAVAARVDGWQAGARAAARAAARVEKDVHGPAVSREDFFAGLALRAILGGLMLRLPLQEIDPEHVANQARRFAAAMLAQREK